MSMECSNKYESQNTGFTGGEKNIGAPKMRNNFWNTIKCPLMQYCDNNLELYAVSAYKVTALDLLCFIFCNSSFLFALLFAIVFKSDKSYNYCPFKVIKIVKSPVFESAP